MLYCLILRRTCLFAVSPLLLLEYLFPIPNFPLPTSYFPPLTLILLYLKNGHTNNQLAPLPEESQEGLSLGARFLGEEEQVLAVVFLMDSYQDEEYES